MLGRTHGPPATKNAGGSTTGSARTTGIPCAIVLRLIRDLPGVPGLLAPVASQNRLQDLTSASGRQDHTISPSANTSRASRHLGVHRIPIPTSVATRVRPSVRDRTRGLVEVICPTAQARAGATDQHDGQNVHGCDADLLAPDRGVILRDSREWALLG